MKERLEEAKKKNEIDLNENILLKLPLLLDQLKHEARKCQSNYFSFFKKASYIIHFAY